MLYGLDLVMQPPPSTIGPAPKPEMPDLRRKLAAINDETHDIVEFPSNFTDLPMLLKARIWSLKMERSKKPLRKNMHENQYKLIDKYKKMSDDMSKQAGRKAIDTFQADKSHLNYYRAIEPGIREHGQGHCGEYSALAVNMLLRDGTPSETIRLLKGPLICGKPGQNHVAVVVGAEPDADPADPVSYGRCAVVCDPWLDLARSAIGYSRWLEKLDCKFRPNELAGLHEHV